jgi:hypothetical protein
LFNVTLGAITNEVDVHELPVVTAWLTTLDTGAVDESETFPSVNVATATPPEVAPVAVRVNVTPKSCSWTS